MVDAEKTILIVDDDIAFTESIEAFLNQKNINCLTANTAKLALNIIRHANIDAVSTDLDMPGMKGDEFARLVKELEPSIPVIMLSGAMNMPKKQDLAGELYAVFSKPPKLLEEFLPACEKAAELGSQKRAERSVRIAIRALQRKHIATLIKTNPFANETLDYARQNDLSIHNLETTALSEIPENIDLLIVEAGSYETENILELVSKVRDRNERTKVVLTGQTEDIPFFIKESCILTGPDQNPESAIMAASQELTVQDAAIDILELDFDNVPSINQEYLSDLKKLDSLPGNSGFYQSQINSFLDRSETYADFMKSAIKAENLKDVSHCAHRLISICGFVGATKASKMAQYIEMHTEEVKDDLESILERLVLELRHVQESLKIEVDLYQNKQLPGKFNCLT